MKNLKDLTPEDVMALPMEVVRQLIPPHLRARPTTNPELAYWYMASQTGPSGHLPCPAGAGCATCPDTYRALHEGHHIPLTEFEDPDAEVKADVLIRDWYRAGGSSVAPDDDLFLPFDPESVP